MGVARLYRIETPYAASDLPLLKFTQSADVMTLTHPRYAPRELSREGHADWSLDVISFEASVGIPGSVAASPTNSVTASPTRTLTYVVSAVTPKGEVGEASAPASTTNNYLSQSGNVTNQITWAAVAGAEAYNVYRSVNGIYGWIGRAVGLSFIDDNIAPDTADTPPVPKEYFAAENWPGVVELFDQRRLFGSSLAKPQTVWGTRPGLFNNFTASMPLRDDDAFETTLAAKQPQEVRWLVALDDLVVLTASGAWVFAPGDGKVMTPTTGAKMKGNIGAAHLPPIMVDNRVLFVQERGSFVRDLGYDFSSNGYPADDLCLLGRHLFVGRKIKEWCWAQEPDRIVWCVMTDGRLLGLTYIRDQEIWAWHRHATDGVFESVCSIPEGGRDVPYFVVRRNIDGVDRRYIERLRPQEFFGAAEDAWRVDCGLEYRGEPVSVLSGIEHLEGKQVVALADGALVSGLTVTDRTITLPFTASHVIVGLPYDPEIETLRPTDVRMQLNAKNVARVTLRVENTRGLSFGPPGREIYLYKDRLSTAGDGPPALVTGDIPLNTAGSWNEVGATLIKGTPGLPATILAIIPEIVAGG